MMTNNTSKIKKHGQLVLKKNLLSSIIGYVAVLIIKTLPSPPKQKAKLSLRSKVYYSFSTMCVFFSSESTIFLQKCPDFYTHTNFLVALFDCMVPCELVF